MSDFYEIVEMEGRGKVMIAKLDINSGVDLLREEPLLFLSREYIHAFEAFGDLQGT